MADFLPSALMFSIVLVILIPFVKAAIIGCGLGTLRTGIFVLNFVKNINLIGILFPVVLVL